MNYLVGIIIGTIVPIGIFVTCVKLKECYYGHRQHDNDLESNYHTFDNII